MYFWQFSDKIWKKEGNLRCSEDSSADTQMETSSERSLLLRELGNKFFHVWLAHLHPLQWTLHYMYVTYIQWDIIHYINLRNFYQILNSVNEQYLKTMVKCPKTRDKHCNWCPFIFTLHFTKTKTFQSRTNTYSWSETLWFRLVLSK